MSLRVQKKAVVRTLMQDNVLLGLLKDSVREELAARFEPVDLQRADVLVDVGEQVSYAYFPCDGVLISYLVVLPNGATVETGLIGREGAVSGVISHGSLPAFARCEVQAPGPALRIAIRHLEKLRQAHRDLEDVMVRYGDCLLAQIFQSVACNASHTIEQRAAKWLLTVAERTGELKINLRQDQLASMLGVGRSYVTRVLTRLREGGVLASQRRVIAVSDMKGLHRAACACNDVTRAHFKTVLGAYPGEEVA